MDSCLKAWSSEQVHPDLSKATLRRRRADSAQAQSLCHHDVALFKGRGETTLGDCFLLTSSLPSLATC